MGLLQAGFALALAVAAVTVAVQWRRTRGIRRRLLAIVIVSALLPALGVVLVSVGTARDLLGLLDAPGLRAAMDGGLGLARAVLEREHSLLVAWADSVAAAPDPAELPVAAGRGWVLHDARGQERASAGEAAQRFLAALPPGRAGDRPRRVTSTDATALVYERPHGGGSLVVVQVLPAPLAADLARVEVGSQGLLQVGLYYRELVGTRMLLLASAALVLVALLTVGAGRAASERLVQPLADLVDGTRRVAGGDLGHRVRVRGVGEVSELVAAFNGMTERLAASEERRRRSERLAAWQGIARRLAHEIKNPLTPIQLALHRVRRRDADPVTREALDAIEEETRNLQHLAEEFSALGRLPEPQPRAVALRPLLQEVSALYVPESVELRWEGVGDPVLLADPGQLRQVLSNLVKNAVEAMARQGTLRFGIAAGECGRACWSIEDDGPGLPEAPAQIFEPGFTTRATGSGLGLAIVERIVQDHGATIEATNAPDGGARFRLCWPEFDVEPRTPTARSEST